MEAIRAFIAVDLSPEIVRELGSVLKQLQPRLRGGAVRWVPVSNMHLTLKFLGDVSVTNIDLVVKILEAEASQYDPFQIEVGQLGAFPSAHRARVIWVGVQAPPVLAQLQHEIDQQTARLGYPSEDRKFSPHLTLGRVSRNATPQDIRQIDEVLSSVAVGSLGNAPIESIHLYRSDLNPQGAVYHRLFSAALKKTQPDQQ